MKIPAFFSCAALHECPRISAFKPAVFAATVVTRTRHRGNTYLTSLPSVSVRHHGRVNSVKVEIHLVESRCRNIKCSSRDHIWNISIPTCVVCSPLFVPSQERKSVQDAPADTQASDCILLKLRKKRGSGKKEESNFVLQFTEPALDYCAREDSRCIFCVKREILVILRRLSVSIHVGHSRPLKREL